MIIRVFLFLCLSPLLAPFYFSIHLYGAPELDRERIVQIAKSYMGSPYRYGGSSPAGFDCSGFARYVYGETGVKLPHSSIIQYATLNPVKVPRQGDLFFFRTAGRRISHVGIYLGNFRFIHAPGKGKRIRIDDIRNPYWRKAYAGSRTL